MVQIQVEHHPGGIEGLAVITPTMHMDARGYFMETFNRAEMRAEGLDREFVQDNQSKSSKAVLRGLHFQKQFPQAKLVKVYSGSAYDVVVDLRKGSPTYGSYYGLILDDVRNQMLFVPEGFAHGFLVLSDYAVFSYKVTDFWHPHDEGGLAWDDPELGIRWPLEMLGSSELLLSDKDRINPTLKELTASGFTGF
ncbi:MAG: dTDP-4-dehydrorhamnose 3,5-epimerase [Candidatus Limiplasma sp.]|nr:dTDP-4-dehydrorhamnose 3,5-epimerase [Candidatus Limiplasma sp.]